MRKIALLATVVVAVFGLAAVAYAENTYTVTVAKVTPSKAGTRAHPKPIKIDFGYTVGETTGNRPAVTTDYIIAFGKNIKQNRSFFKGNKVCTIAQAGYLTGAKPKCPAASKSGGGSIQNKFGDANIPSQATPCNLGLTTYIGDGKAVPGSANDGIPVKNDIVLAIKRVNVADCATDVDAAIPAGFVVTSNGTALKFHVKSVPFQQPLPGVDNSVVNVTSSLFKTTPHRQKVGRVFRNVTRGLFESIGCTSHAHVVNVQFTPKGGGAAKTAVKSAPCTK